MSRLSRLKFWRRNHSQLHKRESAASSTSAAGPSRTIDQVQEDTAPSSTVSGSPTGVVSSGAVLVPTSTSQPDPDTLQSTRTRSEQCNEQDCERPELPEPYATTSALWLEALKYLKESGKGEDAQVIEDLFNKVDGGPPKDTDTKRLATEGIQKAVEDALKEQQHDSKTARIMKQALEVVMKFVSVVDVAVSADPLHAALPWAFVRFVLMGLAAGTKLRSELLATITIVGSLFAQCDRYEQLYLTQDPDLLPPKDALETLKESIVRAYGKSQVFISFTLQFVKTRSRYVTPALKLSDVESYIDELQQCGEKLSQAAEYCEMRCSSSNRSNVIELLELSKNAYRSIRDQIKIVLDQIDEREQIHMLDWISPVQYGKHHKRVEEARTAGTCEWLLRHEKFREWDEADSSVILWLQGSPGAGKTFLTSKVITHTQVRLKQKRNQEGFAFFYCDRNDEQRRDPLSVLQSYVRQLSTTIENPECVRPQLLGFCKKLRQNASGLGFDDCADQLLESVNLYRKTTLVLDALDECEPDSRKSIIKTMEVLLSKSQQPLKIFISSRPDRDIRSRFLDRPNIEIEAWHNKRDIRIYVNKEIINHGGWKDMRDGLREKIVASLLEKNQGMFQWVFLQIKQILRLETERAILDRLGKLPADLKAAYDEIYERIKSRHGSDRILADNAFKWVMCAKKPLSSRKLLSALRINSETDTFELSEKLTESQLLHLCSNLLLIDSQRKVWRFSHSSVAEYFEENHWSRKEAHSYAAKVCLKLAIEPYKYLDLDHVYDSDRHHSYYEGDDDYEDQDDDIDDDRQVFNLNHPFKEYAQNYWIYHTQAQEGEVVDPLLTQLLKSFLGSPEESSLSYRSWLCNIPPSIYGGISGVPSRELRPENIALFVMCRFSFYHVLLDWWKYAKFDVSQTSMSGRSLLALAAMGGSVPMCENLIKRAQDAKLPRENFLGKALIVSAEYGQTEAVKLLLSKGAGVDTRAEYGEGKSVNALTNAAMYGHLETVELLVQAGADVNMVLNNSYGTALAAAACHSNIGVVKYLIDAGADINMQLQYGRCGSALAAATTPVGNIFVDNVKLVKILVEAGADINMQLQYGRYGSALAAAAAAASPSYNSIGVVKFLVEAGADINMQLQYGRYGSALDAAAAAAGLSYNSIRVVKFLGSRGKGRT
ncbi:hypothetical protein F5Y07DRAFT_321402 [Xylaria sp. FL0933]|nr:hypothetical protein F5Y07DRAFT_321402 [Xylaria sp. FL0933]